METLRRDLLYAIRSLRRSPAFTAVAVLTLALGIGANTAIFSVVDTFLLRTLPYTDAERLVRIFSRATDGTSERGPTSAGDYVDLTARQRSFAALAALRTATTIHALTGQGEPRPLVGGEVSASMFSVLGTPAQLGRTFAPGDGVPGAPPVVVLGDGAWRSVFGADPGVVGRSIVLDDTARTVVGVLPPGVGVPGLDAELWLPLQLDPVLRDPARIRGRGWLGVIARLAPDTTIDAAREEVARIGRQLEREYPDSNGGHGLATLALRDALVGQIRPTVLALFGASGLVLVIACVNLAGMFLARLLTRRREQAIRSALGAGPLRLVRQMLTESAVLAAVGGGLGLLLARIGTDTLLAAAPVTDVPLAGGALNARVLAFTGATAMAVALLFGAAPALAGTRGDIRRSLGGGGRGATQGDRHRVRMALLAAQFALAMVLCVGAGLLVRSLAALHRVQLGFESTRVLTFGVPLSGERYGTPEDQARLFDRLAQRLDGLPGVAAVAAASNLPLTPTGRMGVVVEGRVDTRAGIEFVDHAAVSEEYFRTLGIPLHRGRTFGPVDGSESPPVAVVSRRMAELYWPGADPVGRRIKLGPDPGAPWYEVVGIVGDVRQAGVAEEPQPMAYVPARQEWFSPVVIVVPATGDPLTLEDPARAALEAVDPLLPMLDVQPVEALVERDLADRRFLVLLLSLFAVLALVLASAGVYGVTAHGVSSRTREFAVRMALGSTRRGVLAMVLRQGFGTALVGLLVGLAGVAVLAPVLRRFLFAVHPMDAAVTAAAALVLLVVTLLAAIGPGQRAARVQPMRALRAE